MLSLNKIVRNTLILVFMVLAVHVVGQSTLSSSKVLLGTTMVQLDEFDEYKLEIHIDVRDGWYVFAESNTNNHYVPLHVFIELPKGIEPISGLELSTVSNAETVHGFNLYSGKISFTQHVRLFNPNELNSQIVGSIGFQACNLKHVCSPSNEVFIVSK